jgi:hypothetical protein
LSTLFTATTHANRVIEGSAIAPKKMQKKKMAANFWNACEEQ